VNAVAQRIVCAMAGEHGLGGGLNRAGLAGEVGTGAAPTGL